MLVSIPFGFMRTYGPKVWRDIDRYQKIATSGDTAPEDEVPSWRRLLGYSPLTCCSPCQPRNVLYLIVKTYTPQDGSRIGVFRRLYIAILLLWSVARLYQSHLRSPPFLV